MVILGCDVLQGKAFPELPLLDYWKWWQHLYFLYIIKKIVLKFNAVLVFIKCQLNLTYSVCSIWLDERYVPTVRKASEIFLFDLAGQWEEDLMLPDVCSVINKHTQGTFRVYVEYCSNQVRFQRTLQRLMWVQVTIQYTYISLLLSLFYQYPLPVYIFE